MVKAFHLHIIGNQLDIPRRVWKVLGHGRYTVPLRCWIISMLYTYHNSLSGTKDARIRTRSLVLRERESGNRSDQGNPELGLIFYSTLVSSPAASAGFSACYRHVWRGIHRINQNPEYQRHWGLHYFSPPASQGSGCPFNHPGPLPSVVQHRSQ